MLRWRDRRVVAAERLSLRRLNAGAPNFGFSVYLSSEKKAEMRWTCGSRHALTRRRPRSLLRRHSPGAISMGQKIISLNGPLAQIRL